jgi:hypothetical protein
MASQEENIDLEQLKLLFDYTKFHIGLYTTIAAIFAGLISSKEAIFVYDVHWLMAATISICLAGFAGGVLASSMCHARGMSDFWGKPLGPFRLKLWRAEIWTYVEHSLFWLSVICALIAFMRCAFSTC